MFSVLVHDTDPVLAEAEAAGLAKEGFTVHRTASDDDALDLLGRLNIDLCLIDTDLNGIPGSGFLFLKRLRQTHPHLPVVFTTEGNLDDFIGSLLRYDTGHVLLKPIPAETLARTLRKVITGQDIFGLHNCITNPLELRKLRLVRSAQIRSAIDRILQAANDWGFSSLDLDTIRLLLQETLVNALYHSHGKTKEKLDRTAITLPQGKYVDAVYGHNGRKFGAAIIDYNGTLSRRTILQTLFDVAEQDRLMQAAMRNPGTGIPSFPESGRGIDLIRKLAGEYSFNIRRGYLTEIVLVFDRDFPKDDHRSSLNIFEIE